MDDSASPSHLEPLPNDNIAEVRDLLFGDPTTRQRRAEMNAKTAEIPAAIDNMEAKVDERLGYFEEMYEDHLQDVKTAKIKVQPKPPRATPAPEVAVEFDAEKRIEQVETLLNTRIDSLEARVENLESRILAALESNSKSHLEELAALRAQLAQMQPSPFELAE